MNLGWDVETGPARGGVTEGAYSVFTILWPLCLKSGLNFDRFEASVYCPLKCIRKSKCPINGFNQSVFLYWLSSQFMEPDYIN